MNGKVNWINCAKFLAIIGVIIDHTVGILYNNTYISIGSYYSVSLFILVAGMTSYISNKKRSESWLENFMRNSKEIFISYCIATAVYLIFKTHVFDFAAYKTSLLNFNAAAPFYYVLLYIQLMLVNRPLFNFLEDPKSNAAKDFTMLVGIVVFAYFTTNYTTINNVYGGGGKVLGGTYLILYYLGMLIVKYKILEKRPATHTFAIAIGSLISYVLLVKYTVDTNFKLDNILLFGNGKNPPGISLMLMGVLMLLFAYSFFTFLENFNYVERITYFTSKLGGYTLHIFLYHLLILSIINGINYESMFIKRIIVIAAMIFASIAIGVIIEKIRKYIKKYTVLN